MPPDLWFDPSGGLFGTPPTTGVGPTGTGGTVNVYAPYQGSPETAWCQLDSSLPGPTGWITIATGLTQAEVTAQYPGVLGCGTGTGLGLGGGGGVTLPAGLGSGGGEIQPPTEQPPSTCPQCGCVTCQCQSQPTEPPQRSCYLLPNGQYVWLTQSDEVPGNATPCSGVTQIQPEQPPQTQTPPDFGPTDLPVQPEPPANACISQLPFASPDWCQCAEQWRQKFAQIGANFLAATESGQYVESGLGDNAYAFINSILPDIGIITQQIQPFNLDYTRDIRDKVIELEGMIYGERALELIGVCYVRSYVDYIESVHGDWSVEDHSGETQRLGVEVFGLGEGVDFGDKYSRGAGGSIGFKFGQLRRVLDQLEEYFAPTRPAPIPLALNIFASNGIDLAGLQCTFAANGLHPGWAEPAALAERERPQAFEWISYWRRGKITDRQLATALRGRNYLLPEEQQVLVTVSEVIPPPTDLVRFMLRSIGDPQVVQRFQLEDEFDQLYQGRIKDWGKANGITEEVLRGYHAAHWVVPGPADLATFWQRFGEDRSSVQANVLSKKMSRQDYDRALREQGIAPFWREFFVAAQYTVASRRDLQYAYQIGAYSQSEILDGLLDIGYSPSVAPRVKKIISSRAVDAWTKDPVVSAYKKNGINQTALSAYLQDRGCPQEVQIEVLRIIRIEATEIANEEFVKLLEKQYELGQLDDQGLASGLLALGFDQDQIARLVLLSRNRKGARPKQIPAAELCRFYGGLLISRTEFLSRLVTLGYTPNDAELIVAKCELDLEARQLKQLQMLMKQQAASERRQLKDMQLAERQAQLAKARDAKALADQIKAQRAAETALEREQAKAEAAAKRAEARAIALAKQAEADELRIQNLIEHISLLWAKANGTDPESAATELVAAVQNATADGTYTVSEILRAVESRLVHGTKDYPPLLSDLVSSLLPLIAQATAIAPEQPTNGEAPSQPIEPTSQ